MTDVIIIGAGAAGMMCAAEAAGRGRSVILLDHSDKPGRKIIISGGGRCNFTNMHASPENFLSQNSHFCKSALKRYTQYDFLDLVEKHAISWHEKKLGQLFCDKSSRDIVKMLLDECDAAGVKLLTGCKVNNISRSGEGFTIDSSMGNFKARNVVIATGGLSVPGTGASGFGYQVAEQFGLDIIPTRAALVPFLWNEEDKAVFESLSGISLPCIMSCGNGSFEENLLFTHKGLSGPAVLQISSFWDDECAVSVDLLPETNGDFLRVAKQGSPGKTAADILQKYFPKRVFETFKQNWLKNPKPLAQITNTEIDRISLLFKDWQVKPADTEGYRTAEVTVGGVNTDELSSKTMESKKVKGLFFIGEVVDVTGWLGGYNFQWAWSSGWCCGQYC